MFKRHFFLVSALVVVVAMAGFAAVKLLPFGGDGQANAQQQGGPPGAGGGRGGGGRGGGGAPMVTPAVIAVQTFADRLQVLGVAKGRESITVTSNSSDLVDAVLFRPGDQVRRDQVLLRLRSTEEAASVTSAQSDVNLAQANADRWNELVRRGVAPKSESDTYNAALNRAKASLEGAQSRAADRVIRAPFSGVIGLTDIAAGALISPGTAIATLDDISVVRVDFDVPDRFLSKVREGARITAVTDAYPGEEYAGRVARLDTRIDERTRTIKVRAEIPNPGQRLKPGMLMRVGIDQGVRQSPAAPEAAVQFSGNAAYVYVITERNGGAVAEQRPVIVGTIQNGLVEIREGLQPGERVVADGLNRVQPNQSIRLAGAEGPAGAGGPPPGAGRGPGAPAPAAPAAGPARPAGQAPTAAAPKGANPS